MLVKTLKKRLTFFDSKREKNPKKQTCRFNLIKFLVSLSANLVWLAWNKYYKISITIVLLLHCSNEKGCSQNKKSNLEKGFLRGKYNKA